MDRILVVGGAGYIGSVLCSRLLSLGFRVRALDRLSFGGAPLLSCVGHKLFEFVGTDLRDRVATNSALEGVDAVVALAAIVGDPACRQQPAEAESINLEGICALAEWSRSKGVRRFLLASTCSNYGVTSDGVPATEEDLLNPLSLYARTKVETERVVLALANGTFEPVGLRFATAFGMSPRMRFDLLVNEFTRDAVCDGEFEVYGEQFWRPYVHTHDLARAIVAVIQAPGSQVSGEVFNVGGDDENYTKREIAELIVQEVPGTRVKTVPQQDDPRSYCVSFAKIQSTLGFLPEYTVAEGVREIVAVLRAGIIADAHCPIYRNSP